MITNHNVLLGVRGKAIGLMVVILLCLGLVACGDDPEMQRQQAQIALDNGKPDVALRLAEKVLDYDSEDVDGQRVRAMALIGLNRFDDAEVVLEWLGDHQVDAEMLGEVKQEWVVGRLHQLLTQADFSGNSERQSQFDEVLKSGQAMSVDVPLLRARLYELDAARLQQVINHREKASRHIRETSGNQNVTELRLARDGRLELAREAVNKKLAMEPENLEALAMEASYAGRVEEWLRLWEITGYVAELQDLPIQLSAGMIVRISQIPNSVVPQADRIERSKAIKQRVREADRQSMLMDMSEARIAIMNNDSESAIVPLEAVIKIDPQNIDARFMLAAMLLSTGELEKSEAMLFRLANEIPNAARVHALYGKTLMERGDLPRATKALEKAVSLDKNDRIARAALTQLMVLRGELSQARAQMERQYQDDPTNIRANRSVIELAQQQGRRDDVRRMLERLESRVPIESMSESHLALLIDGYRYLRRHKKVFRYATILAERRPDASESQIVLADALLESGDEATARRMLESAREKDPSLASVDQLIGQLHLGRYAFVDAARVLRGVVDGAPKNLKVRLDLVSALAGAGQFEQALNQLEIALEQQPDSQASHRMGCRIYQILGRRDKVSEHLSYLDLTQLDAIRDASLLAQAKLNEGDSEEALRLCGRAVADGKTDPMLRIMMSRIYQERGQASDAEAQLMALVRQSPNNPQSYSILTSYFQQVDPERGVLELDRLVGLNTPLVRLSQASLLMSLNRTGEIPALLEPLLTPLIEARQMMVLPVAQTLSQIYKRENKFDAAEAVYSRLIKAGIMPMGSQLRVIELMLDRGDREGAADKLGKLAGELPTSDAVLFRRAAGLYARLGDIERAKPMIVRWRLAHPDDGASYAWEAGVAANAGELVLASSAFAKAVAMSPENLALRQHWAEQLIDSRDYASAEAVLSEMAELGGDGAMLALTSKARLYLAVGLDREAARTVDLLEGRRHTFDSQLTLGIGRAYYTLARYEDAQEQLEGISKSSVEYGPAQVLLSRIDLMEGREESARSRMIGLAESPSGRMTAEHEINQLRFTDPGEKRLLLLIDSVVDLGTLPAALRGRWAARRSRLLADRGQWLEALNATAIWTSAMPNEIDPWSVRLSLLVQLGRRDEVIRELSRQSEWATTPFGQLASVAVGGPVKPTFVMAGVLNYLSQGDVVNAKKASDELGASVMIFRSDLKTLVGHASANTFIEKNRGRRLAGALLSMQSGLSRLAWEQAKSVVEEVPNAVLGYAIMAQALTSLEEPVDDVIGRVSEHAKGSTLLPYLQHRVARKAGQMSQAAELMEQVLGYEPDNVHVQYAVTELWHLSGDVDRAIAGLEPMSVNAGPYQFAATNDLAYLLAENRSDRLEEAKQIAESAYTTHSEAAVLLDTLGWIDHLRGKNEQALRRLNEAIVALRDVPQVHYHLAQVYRALGNDRWTRYHLSAAADGPAELPEAQRARELLANVSN